MNTKELKKYNEAIKNIKIVNNFVNNYTGNVPIKQSVKYNEIIGSVYNIEKFINKFPNNKFINDEYLKIKTNINNYVCENKLEINTIINKNDNWKNLNLEIPINLTFKMPNLTTFEIKKSKINAGMDQLTALIKNTVLEFLKESSM